MQTSFIKNIKTINEINKKKGKATNLFGLGSLSLIAACAIDEGAVNNPNNTNTVTPTDDLTPTIELPFQASDLSMAESGFMTTVGGDTTSFFVELSDGTASKILTFEDGREDASNMARILQSTSIEDKYDLVISSFTVSKDSTTGNTEYQKGRIFIYWDVAEVIDEASPHLEIKGGTKGDLIGTYAPEFLKLGGDSNNYEMIIRSETVDNFTSGASNTNEGAIYILWDIADYARTDDEVVVNKVIDLGKLGTADENASSGSLAIYGKGPNDNIGRTEYQFLQIGGKDNNHDIVIREPSIDIDFNTNSSTSEGAIFILWDVADYAGDNKNITLQGNVSDATAGSLAIYGERIVDLIGTFAPEFLQIGGKDDNYDMVIRSANVDKLDGGAAHTNEGAIYILWDVADYAAAGAVKNLKISLDGNDATSGNGSDATSGLLTIYGRAANQQLGSDSHNILYGADDTAGNKTLTNIDDDTAGTNDITFQDRYFTYVLFGDKVASVDGAGNVISKTVDLIAIDSVLGISGAGYFNYAFDPNGLGAATASTSTADRVGYRFADKTHANVTDIKANLPSSLSDTDADLGVWDIA